MLGQQITLPQMCHIVEQLMHGTSGTSLIGASLRIGKALACFNKEQHHEPLLKLAYGLRSQRI